MIAPEKIAGLRRELRYGPVVFRSGGKVERMAEGYRATSPGHVALDTGSIERAYVWALGRFERKGPLILREPSERDWGDVPFSGGPDEEPATRADLRALAGLLRAVVGVRAGNA